MACRILYGGHNDCETANASLLSALRSRPTLVKSCHGVLAAALAMESWNTPLC